MWQVAMIFFLHVEGVGGVGGGFVLKKGGWY